MAFERQEEPADIRHHRTDYEDQLVEHEAELGFTELDAATYRALCRSAHDAIDRFLVQHRAAPACA